MGGTSLNEQLNMDSQIGELEDIDFYQINVHH